MLLFSSIMASLILLLFSKNANASDNRMEEDKKISFKYILFGIFFIAGGILSITNKVSALLGLVLYIGIMMTVRGISLVIAGIGSKKESGKTLMPLIMMGVINTILGILILSNKVFAGVTLLYVVAIMVIVDAVGNFLTLRSSEKGHFIGRLLGSIAGLVIGVLLFMNPVLTAKLTAIFLGIYFITIGVAFLVEGITGEKKEH